MFNLKILYGVIACLVVGGIVLILCAGLSFYNEFTKSSYVILGSVGLYIFNGVACEYIMRSQSHALGKCDIACQDSSCDSSNVFLSFI